MLKAAKIRIANRKFVTGPASTNNARFHTGWAGHVCDFCRSEEHTSELQSLMRSSYAVFCMQKQKNDFQSARDQPSSASEHRGCYHTTHCHVQPYRQARII